MFMENQNGNLTHSLSGVKREDSTQSGHLACSGCNSVTGTHAWVLPTGLGEEGFWGSAVNPGSRLRVEGWEGDSPRLVVSREAGSPWHSARPITEGGCLYVYFESAP